MKAKLFLTGLAAVALSACGGGGSGDTPAASTPTVAPTTTKITGTAAVGAALGNARVDVKCAKGSGSATTAANGTYTISIDNAELPCVLGVATPDGTVLHSVVEKGSGTAPVANITPLTELLTAALAKGSTTAFFQQFDAAAQDRLTSANVASATDSVRLVLTGVVDLTGFDLLKAPLVAANGGNAGNAFDKLLDTLGERLAAAGTKVSDLAEAVGSNAGAAAIQTVLQPASATCAGMRTGDYYFIAPGAAFFAARFDAKTLQLTMRPDFDPTATAVPLPFAPDATEACRFNALDSIPVSAMVSKSGISLLNVGGSFPAVMVPVQALPLADLAGDWNGLGFERDDPSLPFGPTRVTFSVNASGKFTAGADCTGPSTCEAWPAAELPTLTANVNGGFDMTDSNGSQRAVAFKGTDGGVTLVITYADGFMVATRQTPRAAPALNSVTTFWDYTMFPDTTAMLETRTNTVTAVNTQLGTYSVRRDDGRVSTWTLNTPTNGLRTRPQTVDAHATVGMVLGNTGVYVAISQNPAVPFYGISVNQPTK